MNRPTSVLLNPALADPTFARVPRSVGIEITARCNLRCLHCFNHSGPDNPAELPLERIESILDEMKSWHVRAIRISGGEPTVHRQFRDVVAACQARGIAIGLNTNGIYPPTILAYLKTAPIDRFLVSLDGLEAHNDRIRGQGTFARVVDVCRQLKAAGQHVVISFHVSDDNRHDVPGLVALAAELSVDFKMAPLRPVGRARNLSHTVGRARLPAQEDSPATAQAGRALLPVQEDSPATAQVGRALLPVQEDSPATARVGRALLPVQEDSPATARVGRALLPVQEDSPATARVGRALLPVQEDSPATARVGRALLPVQEDSPATARVGRALLPVQAAGTGKSARPTLPAELPRFLIRPADYLAVVRQLTLLRRQTAHIRIFTDFDLLDGPDLSQGSRDPHKATCAAGRTTINVCANGAVLPCAFFDGVDGDFSAGNVFRESLTEIWQRPDTFRAFRVHQKCGTCQACDYYQRRCNAGCPAVAYAVTGRLDALDPTCFAQLIEREACGSAADPEPPPAARRDTPSKES